MAAWTPRPPKAKYGGDNDRSFNWDSPNNLPPRFVDLKKQLWKDELVESWNQVLAALHEKTEHVAKLGADVIPRVTHAELVQGLSPENLQKLEDTGVIIVTDSFTEKQALDWKQSVRDYAAINKEHLKGKWFPAHNIQIFELYNSPAQIEARTHPNMISTHKALLSLLYNSIPKKYDVDLRYPLSYFDRLRIRLPGDTTFKLGPHVDGGSVERWEDPGYRAVYQKILSGGSSWKDYDPFDVSQRADAKQDLYHAANTCSIFRPWQGWTSLSNTGPNGGTLRVVPIFKEMSAYMMLRPFFRLKEGAPPKSLKSEDWEVDLETSAFPGCMTGDKQKFTNDTHPHLRLDETLVAIPKVRPGDQVYWFCDILHAVEFEHQGAEDSSVFYIPALSSLESATYLRDQRETFNAGLPAPDFPSGEGESKFTGRITEKDIPHFEGRQAIGFERFHPGDDASEEEIEFFTAVNKALGL
ncbi:hypothetical protein VNI00_017152 [Paramarasmius palmivorus]|uniref:DUF1479-domain-containing protein n=1 Tax=Paramarasmius palmivorus TaxID=297713 RepID=A0AAW0B6X6_9AGAR